MSLNVSVEIGNETIVAACGSITDNGDSKISNVEMCVSEGFADGDVVDATVLSEAVKNLLQKVTNGDDVETVQFIIPDNYVVVEKFAATIQNVKVVNKKTLDEAARICFRDFKCKEGYEIADMIPSEVIADGESCTSLPNSFVKTLKVVWRVYVVKSKTLDVWSDFFKNMGFYSIAFIPTDRAYGTAFDLFANRATMSVVDLGADKMRILQFDGGLLKASESIPIGCDSVENDIALAFALTGHQAKILKFNAGEAVRYACSQCQVPIPESETECSSYDLSSVIQCRMEELFEGVIFLLQEWGYAKAGNEVVLVGGGARLKNSNLLFERLSGMKCLQLRYVGVYSNREELQTVPEFCLAEGAMFSVTQEEPQQVSFWDKFKKYV